RSGLPARARAVDVPYDPDRDLIPVTEFGTGPQILGVKADMPVETLQEFIAYAKARPGKLTYAGVGGQTVTAIAAGVLIARAGLDMTLVPYKGFACFHTLPRPSIWLTQAVEAAGSMSILFQGIPAASTPMAGTLTGHPTRG